MKVLSIEQMNRLKELGVDVSNASVGVGQMVFYHGDSWYGVDSYNVHLLKDDDDDTSCFEEEYRTFTLQDIVELLPDTIEVDKNSYYYLILQKETNAYYHCVYENLDLEILHRYTSSTMIESAYQMLLWVIENGYLKTK